MLVAGFGIPTRRDLDFGTHIVKVLDGLAWPQGVLVEDLSYSPHLVLHRLKELRPRKLILVGAVARGAGIPGSVRRRPPELAPVPPELVHQGMLESLSGAAHLDHTLAVLRHWDGLPPETVLIEVEPADCVFGVGFSEELAPCLDRVIELIREEVAGEVVFDVDDPVVDVAAPAECSEELTELVAFARCRRDARAEERQRRPHPQRLPGVETAWRSRPWGIGLDSGSDWYDVFPLDDALVGVVVGDVPGRGAEAVALKSDMRMAVRAYALLEGREPAQLVSCLDRLSIATGRGELTTVLYFTIDGGTGDLRVCSAGQCPPLVLESPAGRSWYLHDTITAPIGANGSSPRHEIETRLAPGSTVLAFTDGLVRHSRRTSAQGLAHLREAANGGGAQPLDALCDNVIRAAVDRKRRDDDAALLGLRLAP